jgi:hypothetical protein
MRKTIIFTLLCIFNINTNAQSFFSYDANALRETKWRYSYMLHVESNSVLHKAEKSYQYYLYFRFDQSYQQFLNGNYMMGAWQLADNQLNYAFQNIEKFKVYSLNTEELVLEFERPNQKGHFQYYFVNAEEDHPFPRPVNELPLVKVKEKRLFNIPWWARPVDKSKGKTPIATPTYINIELVGGGYMGSLDPVTRDYIHIKSDGRLIQEYKSASKGLVMNKKNIPRQELERFCEFVLSQNFFEYQREYDCKDLACESRKKYKPAPIPLRLSIAYGNRKKVVTISIWGIDERRMRYVDYPPALDNIIDAIQRFANRMES